MTAPAHAPAPVEALDVVSAVVDRTHMQSSVSSSQSSMSDTPSFCSSAPPSGTNAPSAAWSAGVDPEPPILPLDLAYRVRVNLYTSPQGERRALDKRGRVLGSRPKDDTVSAQVYSDC